MKNYSIYIFSSKECPPCQRLNGFINTLSSEQIASLQVVPMKTESGALTALAEECSVSLTPTLVAVHHDVVCEQSDDEEWCDIAIRIPDLWWYGKRETRRFQCRDRVMRYCCLVIRS